MNESEINKVKSLSHNISTPLTTILGYIGMIKKNSRNGNVSDLADSIKAEVLKVSKYSKEINDIVSKNRP